MKGKLIIFVQIICIVASSKPYCQDRPPQLITDGQGTISSNGWFPPSQHKCRHSWSFSDLPRNGKLLILNMTQIPTLSKDIVALNEESFIDETEEVSSRYCKILESHPRFAQGGNWKDDFAQTTRLHQMYTGCKVRSGVQAPTLVTYIPSDGLLQQHFTLSYQVVDDPNIASASQTEKPTPTFSPTSETTFHQDPNSPVANKNIDIIATSVPSTSVAESGSKMSTQTKTLVIVAASLVVVFLILMAIMVFMIMRRRRNRRESPKRELKPNSLYQTSSDENQNDNLRVYSEIQSGNNHSRESPSGGTEKEEVLNPLYGQHVKKQTKNSYEYIDVRPISDDEGHSAL